MQNHLCMGDSMLVEKISLYKEFNNYNKSTYLTDSLFSDSGIAYSLTFQLSLLLSLSSSHFYKNKSSSFVWVSLNTIYLGSLKIEIHSHSPYLGSSLNTKLITNSSQVLQWLPNQKSQWQVQGFSRTIKSNFKTFNLQTFLMRG